MAGQKTILLTSQSAGLLAELQRQCPDVAVLVIGTNVPPLESGTQIWCFVDFLLPDISGLEMCRRLRNAKATQDASITMVFEQPDKDLQVRALQAGADDYLVGHLGLEDIIGRIDHSSHPVENPDGPPKMELGDLIVEPLAHRVRYRGKRVDLAPNEFQLLLHFAAHPDRVFSRDDLIRIAGKENEHIEHRTVDVWIGRLRRAFKKVGLAEVIRTVRPLGYVFEVPVQLD